MKINQTHQLVAIQLLNNANFGSASGRVTLDRPTQLDAYSGLPFIPNSSLRGVLRNWWEFQDSPPLQTKLLFGTKDKYQHREESNEPQHVLEIDHEPGNLIIGNGDIIAFPLLAENGKRCWILPLEMICKYIAIEKLYGMTTDIKNVVNALSARTGDNILALGMPGLPAISAPFGFQQIYIVTDTVLAEIRSLHTLLRRWWGAWFPKNESLVIVKGKSAEVLWQQAAEIRDLTAVNKQKTALPQSLRRIETIPEGSLFLSLFTWLHSSELNFSGNVIQVGSNEGSALGFCRMMTIPNTGLTPEQISPEDATFETKELSHKSMENMHRQIVAAARENNEKFNKKLKTIIGDLGWRLKKDGFEPAVAFALARAHPNKTTSQLGDEEKAYRWLLKTLFDKASDLKLYDGQQWFSDPFDEAEKIQIMQRWEWLKKFSEIELS